MNLNNWHLLLADAPATTMQVNPTGATIMNIATVALIGVMAYLVILRPQTKKNKEHAALLSAMKPGDKIVTSGGVLGIIVSVKDKTVSIRSADTKLEILKSAVSEITERSGAASASES